MLQTNIDVMNWDKQEPKNHTGFYLKDTLVDLNPRFKIEALLEKLNPDGVVLKLWFVFFVAEIDQPIHLLIPQSLNSSIWGEFCTSDQVIRPSEGTDDLIDEAELLYQEILANETETPLEQLRIVLNDEFFKSTELNPQELFDGYGKSVNHLMPKWFLDKCGYFISDMNKKPHSKSKWLDSGFEIVRHVQSPEDEGETNE